MGVTLSFAPQCISLCLWRVVFLFHFSVTHLFFSSLSSPTHCLSLQAGPERKCVWRVTVQEATCVWRHRCEPLPLVCGCQMVLWQPTQLPCWPPTPRPPVCLLLWIPCCLSVFSAGVSAPTQVRVCVSVCVFEVFWSASACLLLLLMVKPYVDYIIWLLRCLICFLLCMLQQRFKFSSTVSNPVFTFINW